MSDLSEEDARDKMSEVNKHYREAQKEYGREDELEENPIDIDKVVNHIHKAEEIYYEIMNPPVPRRDKESIRNMLTDDSGEVPNDLRERHSLDVELEEMKMRFNERYPSDRDIEFMRDALEGR